MMTEGRTVLIVKDNSKGTVVGDYRPIGCLPLMWKLLTSMSLEALTDVETVDKYIFRSTVWVFELPQIIAKLT